MIWVIFPFALPEGSVCPIRVPMMTITNTKSEFFWLTNSYCDYGYKPSNNNLTVIDVCG